MGVSIREDLRPPKDVWTPPSARLKAGVAQREINPPVGIRSASWGAAKFMLQLAFITKSARQQW